MATLIIAQSREAYVRFTRGTAHCSVELGHLRHRNVLGNTFVPPG